MKSILLLSNGTQTLHASMTNLWKQIGPDLIMRYEPKGEMSCVECKFRSDLYEDKINWSSSQQLERYKKYAAEHILPFFVVIGLGGGLSYPDRMFCIPLEAKYPALFPSIFERFERDPDKNFFWKNGIPN